MNARLERAREFLVSRYLTVDARTLGLFRICFGLHLICNLYDRTQGPDGIAFYTNEGVMPNHYALFAPAGDKLWSLMFAFSTPAEVQVAFCLIFCVYALYVFGYKTKLAQILAIVCLLSLDNRNLHLQNGGIVVTNVVAIWTAFLPLGARFSIDHLLRSLKERVETEPAELEDRAAMVRSPATFTRFAFFGITFNFAAIYFFNYVHKHGATWHDGSAFHWVLWQNRINTIWAAWVRMHEPPWLSPLATYATLVLEVGLPVWLLIPVAPKWPRRIAIFSIFALHTSISLMMTLGPFSYSMMSFSLLLVGAADWALVSRFLSSKTKLVVYYDPASTMHHALARVLARLDARRALEWSDIRSLAAVQEQTSGDRHRASARLFAVWKRGSAAKCDTTSNSETSQGEPTPAGETSRGETIAKGDKASTVATSAASPRPHDLLDGIDGAVAVVSALPGGALYAWLLRVPPLRGLVERSLFARETIDGQSHFDPEPFSPSPASLFFARVRRVAGEILAVTFFAIVVTQIGVDNWAIPDRYRIKNRPEIQREIVEYLRVPQGWSMFSPDAPKEDGTVIIDATLSDGTHIDPRKQRPPDFDAPLHGPWFDDQQWCDWDLRMHFDGNRHLHPYFRDYIARLDKFRSWKQRAKIEYFEVYWVNNAAPPPGSTRPYNITKQLLFTGGTRP
jgi:hypothetical protein